MLTVANFIGNEEARVRLPHEAPSFMVRIITNIPTDRLYQIFDDLRYEVPLENIWATYQGEQKWNVSYFKS